ncbi:MAG: hypothetical protein CMQ15_00840 [Gammaproteobacteria bacterium]|jgi:hypothetical protein|nr:hypothetical protein [Gammaproteobacteria bacterium]|tara:strand:+ start:528 stop:998 length:471 start_codon:yes stop_codon:yes gene_type:complete
MKLLQLGLVILILVPGCSRQQETESGVFKITGDTKHVMMLVLEPASDVIWDSSGSIITAQGVEDLAPTTEEEWLAVKHSAAVIVESGNLLLLPGRFKDNKDWQEISYGLIDVGQRLITAIDAKDSQAMFDLGGRLYNVCVSCHQLYLTPEQKRTLP